MHRRPFVLASLLCPAMRSSDSFAQGIPQRYDYGFQLYQEADDRIRIESHYVRGRLDLDDATSFRFQWLIDSISGASPTGALPGSGLPFLSSLEDTRIAVLGAISRQFGDHRVELELVRSNEDDYLSHGYALTDTWELNEKNTTVSFGLNYLDDIVTIPVLGRRDKHTYDFFTGVTQILDKNTLVSASITLGYSEGYLNDPYKSVQRTDIVTLPDGLGGTIEFPAVNLYRENRPDSRFRQVLQLEGRHFFEPARGALDAVYRFSHDDYGVDSHTFQLEWRQSVGNHLEITPFFRYYRQGAADFFVQSLDGLPVGVPASDPDGSGPNYSSDYRLSSFDAVSGGVKLRYRFNDTVAATAAYERYEMSGRGANRSPSQAYIDADLWTVGLSVEF